MATEEMSLAEVTGDISKLDDVLFRCLLMGDFQPEEPSRLAESSNRGFAPILEENPYASLLNRARHIGAAIGNSDEKMSPGQAKEYAKCISEFNRKIKEVLPTLQLSNPLFQEELTKIHAQMQGMKKAEWTKMSLTYRLSTARMKAWIGIISSKDLEQTKKWSPELACCCEILQKQEVSWCVIWGDVLHLEDILTRLRDINFREVIIGEPVAKQVTEDGIPYGVAQRMEDLVRKQRRLLEKLEENRGQMKNIGDFAGQHLGIDNVYSCRYLKIRFGILPLEALEQVNANQDAPFVFSSISKENRYYWGVYFTTEDHIKEADDFFASIGFERIWMPQLSAERTQTRIVAWDTFLTDFEKELDSLTDQRKELTSEIQKHTNTLMALRHIRGLDVSFDDIFSCEYLKVRFGRLPVDAYPKLDYFQDHPFIFLPFDKDEQYYWGVYFTTKEHADEINDIFASLYYERIFIPEIAHGTPELAEDTIQKLLDEAQAKLDHLEAAINQCINSHRERYYDIYAMAEYLSDSFSIRKYVGKSDNQFRIVGFIPQKDAKDFVENMSAVEDVHTEIIPPDSMSSLTIPTKLKNNWFVKPFEMFVDMYGMPSYRDVDPTPILAITYSLLFGIMFGDLGQGLVIALVGWFLSRKAADPSFGKILMRIGCFSAVFGFAYGSVFGLEHLLDPVFHAMGFAEKPIEVMNPATINTLLLTAISLGVILILVAMFTNIAIGLRQKNWERAVFGNNGIAGVVFYLAVLIGAVCMLMFDINLFNPLYILAFVVLPIVIIFCKHPLTQLARKEQVHFEDGFGSFAIEGFFELFEVVLSFVTNTMSFLRVGGFIISHAGMMSVVLTLSEMFQGGASMIVLILGNIFVMCLEGFIVGIQCLRLEFYEMFSRYFEGDGEAFQPVVPGKNAE